MWARSQQWGYRPGWEEGQQIFLATMDTCVSRRLLSCKSQLGTHRYIPGQDPWRELLQRHIRSYKWAKDELNTSPEGRWCAAHGSSFNGQQLKFGSSTQQWDSSSACLSQVSTPSAVCNCPYLCFAQGDPDFIRSPCVEFTRQTQRLLKIAVTWWQTWWHSNVNIYAEAVWEHDNGCRVV